MRYKFRAWHIKRKKYYEVLDLHLATVYNGGIWATCLGYDVIEQKDIHIRIEPQDCIIEPYIGISDINNKEIAVGDRLKTDRGLEYILVYLAPNYKAVRENDYSQYYDDIEELEIIGNIHEVKWMKKFTFFVEVETKKEAIEYVKRNFEDLGIKDYDILWVRARKQVMYGFCKYYDVRTISYEVGERKCWQ